MSPQQALPLAGVTACARIFNEESNLDASGPVKSALRRLGAEVLDTLNSRVTHVVWKNGTQAQWDNIMALRLRQGTAGLKCLKLVTPLWVDTCRETQRKVNETVYLVHSMNTNANISKGRNSVELGAQFVLAQDAEYTAVIRSRGSSRRKHQPVVPRTEPDDAAFHSSQQASDSVPGEEAKHISSSLLSNTPASQMEPLRKLTKSEVADLVPGDRVCVWVPSHRQHCDGIIDRINANGSMHIVFKRKKGLPQLPRVPKNQLFTVLNADSSSEEEEDDDDDDDESSVAGSQVSQSSVVDQNQQSAQSVDHATRDVTANEATEALTSARNDSVAMSNAQSQPDFFSPSLISSGSYPNSLNHEAERDNGQAPTTPEPSGHSQSLTQTPPTQLNSQSPSPVVATGRGTSRTATGEVTNSSQRTSLNMAEALPQQQETATAVEQLPKETEITGGSAQHAPQHESRDEAEKTVPIATSVIDSQTSTESEWPCGACSFLNKMSDKKCDVCGTWRPSSRAKPRQRKIRKATPSLGAANMENTKTKLPNSKETAKKSKTASILSEAQNVTDTEAVTRENDQAEPAAVAEKLPTDVAPATATGKVTSINVDAEREAATSFEVHQVRPRSAKHCTPALCSLMF